MKRGQTIGSKAPHGSWSRYTYGCRCDDCRCANTTRHRLWRLTGSTVDRYTVHDAIDDLALALGGR